MIEINNVTGYYTVWYWATEDGIEYRTFKLFDTLTEAKKFARSVK